MVGAEEASGRRDVSLVARGAYIEWTVVAAAQAMDLRFSLPDNAAGMGGQSGTGVQGVLGLYVNGVKVVDMALSSYWAYQYFRTGVYPILTRSRRKRHLCHSTKFISPLWIVRCGRGIRSGCRKTGRTRSLSGVDFIELEPLPPVVGPPAGALSVTNFGAVPDDDGDDLAAFNACIRAAEAGGKSVYIPPGRWILSDKLMLESSGLKILGAGIWYTQLYFFTNRQFYGGIVARASAIEMVGFSLNTANNGRLQYGEEGARTPHSKYKQYKGCSGTYGSGSRIHDLWIEHFECGFWIAGYDPPGEVPITQGLVISNSPDPQQLCGWGKLQSGHFSFRR